MLNGGRLCQHAMTTSGVSTFNPNTFEIITGAARLLSAIQTGETLPDDEYDDALKALNGLTKLWQASGIHVWAEIDCTLFLQPGQIRYLLGTGSPDHAVESANWTQTSTSAPGNTGDATLTLAAAGTIATGYQIGIWLDAGTMFWTTVNGAPSGNIVTLATVLPSQASSGAQVVYYATGLIRPLKVPAGRRYQFSVPGGQPIETPMVVMSRIDYANVPNKTTPGTPTQYFFDPQLNLAVMNIWPAPSNDTVAMKFTAQRPLQDFVTQANTSDLPQEWVSCLRFNLAVELAPEYDCPAERFTIIKGLAEEKLAMCKAWDREPESVMFGVAYDPTSRT